MSQLRLENERSAVEGECGFLAANLYAKSVFGADGKLNGYNIKIRSKTDGIALSNWVTRSLSDRRKETDAHLLGFIIGGIVSSL
ncbi:hypothetical protein BUALT_Bualt14G0110100 [Buddleja alternifolia]|uniref:Uncharacterized protein n=1 Tax=Buddleja alternifolia TaxID=168488 RepID=A0AAV6WIP4_9LAMI|nr:hypothetical protein BUALT_Bualt14G0110100 [Buddleja alternifolia]